MEINCEEVTEFIDIDLDVDGKVKAEVTDKIALIDADTLAYTSCLITEQQEFLLAKEMYSEDEWLNILSNPNYDLENHCIWTIDLDSAYSKAMEKLERIYDKTGCRECEMHFTGGRENFRYTVDTLYKANRTGRSPTGLNDLKLKLLENFEGTMNTKWEADDIVVYKKKVNPDKYIMVAVDKDLIFSLPGKHFNFYESAKYNIEMKWQEVDDITALQWPYAQAVIGDKVDNIKGIHGKGKAAVKKIFAGCTTHSECWEALTGAYEDAKMTKLDAIITMRLVDMHQFDGEKIVLWDYRKFYNVEDEDDS